MNATATYIAARTARIIKRCCGRQSWLDHKPEIIRVLDSLQPDKPEDDTRGFLAYEVDGHKRMKMRTGRFLTRKLRLNNDFLPDTVIQQLATQINAKLFGDTFEIRLDKGQQITRDYEDSIGGDSCMTNSAAQYTRLYESNPDRFQMLVMVCINDTARAIVYKLDNGMYHMSKVYATSEELKIRMMHYARGQGWYYKDNGYTCHNGKQITDFTPLIVSGLSYADNEIPYMDSLKGYRIENSLLTLVHTSHEYCGTCESTCGLLENEYICCACGGHYDEDDIFSENDEYYCTDCYSETFSQCENCNETYFSENIHYVDSAEIAVCQSCLDNNYTCCGDCDEYFKSNKIYPVDGGDKPVCESCLEQGYTCCDNCGGYFSDTIYNEEKEVNYCECCTENNKTKDCGGQLLLSIE